jgi:tetratricopeptide (TPR) repeat protein
MTRYNSNSLRHSETAGVLGWSTFSMKSGDKSQRLMTNFGFHMVNADLPMALEASQELLKLAVDEKDIYLLVDAYCAAGMALFHLGEVRSARTQLEKALSLAGPS